MNPIRDPDDDPTRTLESLMVERAVERIRARTPGRFVVHGGKVIGPDPFRVIHGMLVPIDHFWLALIETSGLVRCFYSGETANSTRVRFLRGYEELCKEEGV